MSKNASSHLEHMPPQLGQASSGSKEGIWGWGRLRVCGGMTSSGLHYASGLAGHLLPLEWTGGRWSRPVLTSHLIRTKSYILERPVKLLKSQLLKDLFSFREAPHKKKRFYLGKFSQICFPTHPPQGFSETWENKR